MSHANLEQYLSKVPFIKRARVSGSGSSLRSGSGSGLRGQAQAVRGKDGEAATPEGGGAAGIPEGVPNEDGGM